MERIVAVLAVTVITIFVVPLAVLRAGVWRQERAASLTSRPRGLSTAIARRVFGLYAHLPERTAGPVARSQNESAIS
jgi:cytochrome c oxidase assembly factor CtaG